MTDPSGSTLTDLLINQPVLVWSLAGGLSILVIAAFLSIFLALRNRAQKKKAASIAAQPERQSQSEEIDTIVSELKMVAEEETPLITVESGEETAVKNVATLGASAAADGAESFVQLNPGGESTTTQDVLSESGEKNELAALFEDDVIVDPYVQALRDNLPSITLEQLLTNIRSVSSELRHHINAEHVNEG
jgi:hypothetical protein